MERVLGVNTDHEHAEVRTEVISLAVQPWLAGAAVAAVQLTVGALRPRNARQSSARR